MNWRPLRRSRQLLSREECEQILCSATSGVLALTGDGDWPYAVPVSHVYADGKIYFHGAKTGHKIDSLRKNDRVSFCVVSRDSVMARERTTAYISVIAFGRARVVEDEADMRRIAGLIGSRFSGDYPELVQQEIDETIAAGTMACVEITVEHMTGKCGLEVMRERKQDGGTY